MPRAVIETSIPAPMLAPALLSRRGLMSAATSAALAGTALVAVNPVAVHAAPTDDDADLLRLCDEFHSAFNFEWREGDFINDAETDRAAAATDAALARVAALRPNTPAGVRAMAGVAYVAFKTNVACLEPDGPWNEHATPEEALVISLLGQIAGLL